MANLDARAAWILLTVLALTAAIGLEQGVVRGLSAVRESGAAPMDEAAVRQIARQEAEAAIARSRPKKAAPEPDADADPDQPLPTAQPPLTVPPPPAATPAQPG